MTATFEIPEYAKTNRELWTPNLVQRAVVFGHIVLSRSQPYVGPAGDRAYWPETFDKEDSPRGGKGRRVFNLQDMTHSEMVTLGFTDRHGGKHPAWMNFPELAEAPTALRTFDQWVRWYVRGRRTAGEYQTEEMFAGTLKMSLATLKRHKACCGRIIGERLNRASVLPWRGPTDKLK
ncbi:MAG: hypothetical protein CML24_11525 [Rhizobiales bacterium]|nr:hypothetical protein [Hyphomicrobiales bacterium]